MKDPRGKGDGEASRLEHADTVERTSAQTPIARGSQLPPMYPFDGPRIEDHGIVGSGGMGEVHRVYDRNIRRYAALKVLDSELELEDHARRRFLAEAQITGQLEHPNIVPVYDLELTDEGKPRHFTMKLVDGVTLTILVTRSRIAKRTEAELYELLLAFLKVCDAISYAHSRGVIHRDIKPDNVMIGSHGQVYVMDWGIARVTGSATGQPSTDETSKLLRPPKRAAPVSIRVDTEDEGAIVGTFHYMAPEQAWGHTSEIDARTDVFSLGAVLFHILTGRAPYEATPMKEMIDVAREARVPHPTEVAPDVPLSPALCAIAMKALAASPDDRYQTVEALKRDVQRAIRGGLSLATKTFRAGTEILKQGDPPDAAYIVTRGRCEAFKTIAGEKKSLREMGPGDVFGEMALLSSRPRSASVVALEDVTAIVVTKEALAREVHSESWLVPLLRTLVDRFRELEERHGS